MRSGAGEIMVKQHCNTFFMKYVFPQEVGPETFAVKGCLKTKSCCRGCGDGGSVDGGSSGGGGVNPDGCGGGGVGDVISCGDGDM
jgi:hypothetical protein